MPPRGQPSPALPAALAISCALTALTVFLPWHEVQEIFPMDRVGPWQTHRAFDDGGVVPLVLLAAAVLLTRLAWRHAARRARIVAGVLAVGLIGLAGMFLLAIPRFSHSDDGHRVVSTDVPTVCAVLWAVSFAIALTLGVLAARRAHLPPLPAARVVG